MVAEVNVASAAKQAVQPSAAEQEPNQPTKRAANNQRAEGVEVRISQRQAEMLSSRISPTRTFVQETGRHLKRNEVLNLERRK